MRALPPLALLFALLVAGCSDSVENAAASGKSDGAAGEVAIGLVTGGDGTATIEVAGFDGPTVRRLEGLDAKAWPKLFELRVDGGDDLPAVLGKHEFDAGKLVFTPRFPLQPGLDYRATWDPSSLGGNLGRPVVETIALPAAPKEPVTVVEAVYPSGDELPENLLKFYLHFSRPMSRGFAYDHVHLFDDSGDEIEAAFLELGEELWDPAGRRFTLFFDPGRVKRELVPRRELGAALEAGRSYRLVVDTGWLDAEGRELADEFEKPFRVVKPDTGQPDPQGWSLAPPAAGTREPLFVTFEEPLDHALLERLLHVEAGDGERRPGSIAIVEGESGWKFTPDEPWQPGEYALVAVRTLEDRAGNGIDRPFEVDLTEKAASSPPDGEEAPAVARLPFTVAAPR